MSMMMRRAAFRPMFRTTRPLRAGSANPTSEAVSQGQRDVSKQSLQKGARRDPELYVRCSSALSPK